MKRIVSIIICLILCTFVFFGCHSEELQKADGDPTATYTEKSTVDPASVKERVYVSSGKDTIEAQKIFAWDSSDGLSADGSGYESMFFYTEEELASIPTLYFAGEISAKLSEDAVEVTSMSEDGLYIINAEEKARSRVTYKEISELGEGVYYFVIETTARFSEDYSRGYHHVFRLIIEKKTNVRRLL